MGFLPQPALSIVSCDPSSVPGKAENPSDLLRPSNAGGA